MEQNNSTQVIENIFRKEDFTSVKNVKGEKTRTDNDSDVSRGEEDRYGFRHIPKLFETLENRFPFTAIVVGIIGYIVIASFGHMENFGSYLRYVIFLGSMFVLYKFLHLGKIELRQVEKINKLTLSVSVLLIIFIIIENFDKVLSAVKSFIR